MDGPGDPLAFFVGLRNACLLSLLFWGLVGFLMFLIFS